MLKTYNIKSCALIVGLATVLCLPITAIADQPTDNLNGCDTMWINKGLTANDIPHDITHLNDRGENGDLHLNDRGENGDLHIKPSPPTGQSLQNANQ